MSIDTEQDLIAMQAVGAVVRDTLAAMRAGVAPGATTGDLDAIAGRVFKAAGARSAPQLVYDFPGITCISVNDEIVHGIPSKKRKLAEGDLVKLDVTAELQGHMADACITVGVGRISATAQALMNAAENAFKKALREVKHGKRAIDIGRVVQAEVTRKGYSVVKLLQGHGIGRTIHEEPMIPNWPDPEATGWLTEGLVITVEPIITAGDGEMVEGKDGWTILSQDGSLAAHYEHTMIVTKGAPRLLTAA